MPQFLSTTYCKLTQSADPTICVDKIETTQLNSNCQFVIIMNKIKKYIFKG